MRHLHRLVLAVATAALLALSAGAAAAGNYAEVGYTDGMEAPPTAGEEREIRLSLLQHGVTPVDFGAVTVTATSPGADPVTVSATSLGGGEWVASLTFPTAGDWQVRVTHSQLETPPGVAVSVAEAALSWPATLVPIVAVTLLALALVAGAVLVRRGTTRVALPASEPSVR